MIHTDSTSVPRIVVLGGAGEMGREAVRLLVERLDAGRVVVADRDEHGAGEISRHLASAGATTTVESVGVDVSDQRSLAACLDGADVVLNAVGPFSRFGVGTLRATIAAGAAYLDICDDWGPTQELLALDAEARAAGVVAIVGMGASPGLTNLMAVQACAGMTQVDDLVVTWPLDVPAGETTVTAAMEDAAGRPSAAVVHLMDQMSGSILAARDGALVPHRPLEPLRLTYPGDRSGTVYAIGHPEPITLVEHLPVTGRVVCAMAVTPTAAGLLRRLRDRIDAGGLTHDEAAALTARPGALRTGRALIDGLRLAGPQALPGYFVLARGLRDGREVTVGLSARAMPPSMAACTSTPLVLALEQVLAGTITRPGVHPPEAVVDAAALMEQLAPYCGDGSRSASEVFVREEAAD